MQENVAEACSLLEQAQKARQNAYAPYSGYSVGAALLCGNGAVYTGCNVENAAYGPTNCAERTAAFKAVSEGNRDFRAIAITGASVEQEAGGYAHPCGVCRQVLAEFCVPDSFRIYVGSSGQDYKFYTLAQLLPHSFGPANLAKE